MKRALFIIVIVLWASSAMAWGTAAMSGMGESTAPGACSSGTADVTHNTTAATLALGTNFVGQSFVPATNGMKLYSIVLKILGNGDGNTTLTMRFGSDVTMASYIEVVVTDHAFLTSRADDVEFVFQDTAALSTGTTYYWVVSANNANGLIYHDNTSGDYAGGKIYWSADGNKWNLTGHDDSGDDADFIIKKCD